MTEALSNWVDTAPADGTLPAPARVEVLSGRTNPGLWWLAGGISAGDPLTGAGCIAAYQAKGAGSYAASLVNLAAHGVYDLMEAAGSGVSAPGWSAAAGWTFDGLAACLGTGFGSAVLGQGTGSVVVKYRGAQANADTAQRLFGASGGFEGERAIWLAAGCDSGSNGQGLASHPDSQGPDGVLALSAGDLYQGRTAYETASDAGWGESSDDTAVFVIGGMRDYLGGVGWFFSGVIEAIAFYSTALSAEQVAAVAYAMEALDGWEGDVDWLFGLLTWGEGLEYRGVAGDYAHILEAEAADGDLAAAQGEVGSSAAYFATFTWSGVSAAKLGYWAVAASLLWAARGRWMRAFARVLLVTGYADLDLQLRFILSNGEPWWVGPWARVVTGHELVGLGSVKLPPVWVEGYGPEGLTVELWARRAVDEQHVLSLDAVQVVPADRWRTAAAVGIGAPSVFDDGMVGRVYSVFDAGVLQRFLVPGGRAALLYPGRSHRFYFAWEDYAAGTPVSGTGVTYPAYVNQRARVRMYYRPRYLSF